jgi:cbb3-type cytochrome oxidase maturation protein
LLLGLTGFAAFLWSLKSGQYDDLDGAAVRILPDDDFEKPNYPFAALERPANRRRQCGSAFRPRQTSVHSVIAIAG